MEFRVLGSPQAWSGDREIILPEGRQRALLAALPLGRYEPAAAHYRQAQSLFRKVGDRFGEAYVFDSLGIIEERLGRYGQAVAHHEQALVVCQRSGNRYGEAWALDGLGTVHTRLGGTDRAAEQHRQALALFHDIGDREGEAWALNGLGEVAHPAVALVHHTAALRIATGIGARDQQARAHTGLGYAHQSLGDRDRARAHYEYALTLYAELGSPEADRVRIRLAGGVPPRHKHTAPA
jgi:tetratricopeptide (TPR) repeat protein